MESGPLGIAAANTRRLAKEKCRALVFLPAMIPKLLGFATTVAATLLATGIAIGRWSQQAHSVANAR